MFMLLSNRGILFRLFCSYPIPTILFPLPPALPYRQLPIPLSQPPYSQLTLSLFSPPLSQHYFLPAHPIPSSPPYPIINKQAIPHLYPNHLYPQPLPQLPYTMQASIPTSRSPSLITLYMYSALPFSLHSPLKGQYHHNQEGMESEC